MPYEVVRLLGKWVVRKEDDHNRVFGRHATRADALAQLRALYANEKK